MRQMFKRIIFIIKAIGRANRCKNEIVFHKFRDGYLVEMVTYKPNMLWTNTDLERMLENGYVVGKFMEVETD